MSRRSMCTFDGAPIASVAIAVIFLLLSFDMSTTTAAAATRTTKSHSPSQSSTLEATPTLVVVPPTPQPATSAPYSGPSQPSSNPAIVNRQQTLITVSTWQALQVANSIKNKIPAPPNASAVATNLDDFLVYYYTYGAAYYLCRLISVFSNIASQGGSFTATGVPQQFLWAAENQWDNVSQVTRLFRNASCSTTAPASWSISVAILTKVPGTLLPYHSYPSTFSCFVVATGASGDEIIRWLSASLSRSYTPAFQPFDLYATLGFQYLTYNSPAAPALTTISSFTVTKDSPITTSGGVAIWTFLVVLSLSICGAVIIGMTVVRWILKPPPMPPLRQRVVTLDADDEAAILRAGRPVSSSSS